MLGTHIKMWFAYTPPASEEEQEAAQAQAEQRFGAFLDYVAEQLASGDTLVNELVQDTIGDDDELAKLTRNGG